jgi:P4 family phage/plasmid primase-like protien
MAKITDEFHTALFDAGLLPNEVIGDGRIYRCRTADRPESHNGWYLYFSNAGVGLFGNWRTGEKHKWTLRNGDNLSPSESELQRRQIVEADRVWLAELNKRQEQARKRAQKIFARCRPARVDHPYLAKKQVKPLVGLRQMKNLLVLPVLDESGKATSLQFIYPDGTKRFLTDGKIQRGFFPINGTNGPLYICEGYATGATIHESTGASILCALNAGNLLAVARMAQRKYPGREIIIAADNDSGTEGNPGITKAQAAGEVIKAPVLWPEFPDGAIGSDFNDLQTVCGLEAVRAQLTIKKQTTGDLFTDLQNATRFAEKHKGKIRFCHKFNKWLVWNEKRWEIDDTGNVWRLAKDHVLSLLNTISSLKDDKERIFFLKEMARVQSERKLTSMLNLARHNEGIPVEPRDMDKNLMLFNCEDATVDLRTFEYLFHKPEHFITKLSPFTINSSVTCPRWKEHIEFIMNGNQSLIEFLQRAFGSCLAGENRDRKLFLLWGSGQNGKSVTLETLQMVLGDYGMKTPAETLLVKRFESIPNDLARLNGARFVYTSEVSEGKKMAEALVKELTGDKYITARFMRGEWFEFPITFKVFLATNHLPTIRGTDPAIWDRICLIPFTVRIPDSEKRAREELLEEFRSEGSGILKWLLDGCHEWLHEGLKPPTDVLAANVSYREQMDCLKGFIDDLCVVGERVHARSADLYKAYERWAKENGEDPISKTSFGKKLREKGFLDYRDTSGLKAWKGIGLIQEGEGS